MFLVARIVLDVVAGGRGRTCYGPRRRSTCLRRSEPLRGPSASVTQRGGGGRRRLRRIASSASISLERLDHLRRELQPSRGFPADARSTTRQGWAGCRVSAAAATRTRPACASRPPPSRRGLRALVTTRSPTMRAMMTGSAHPCASFVVQVDHVAMVICLGCGVVGRRARVQRELGEFGSARQRTRPGERARPRE